MSKRTETTSHTQPAAAAHHHYHENIRVVIGSLMLVMLLASLYQTIVVTALPKIVSELNGLDKYSWVATAFLLTSAISTPIYGKLGDLYGRKKLLQIAIVIFLLGSIFSGMSQNMNQLIAFRGLQGIGAGGLMSLVLAIVGDIIPPRQRGRYQGYFGAVFAISSVAGPLIGGFFADTNTLLGVSGWRWLFYVPVPLGIIALAAIATYLHLPVRRREHSVDYKGIALLTISVTSLLLMSSWGGLTYAWKSPQIISLIASTITFGFLFVLRERRASEPVIPMSLFRNDIFTTSVLLSILSAIAMFAAILYIPQYQQIVRGHTPTQSGLLMLPMVGGMMFASIISGRLISKYGHYKLFPLFGTLVLACGMWLFSHVSVTTSNITLSLWMIVIGVGLGSFQQVATLAVQNSVDPKELGTATSSTTFFRTIGSALGGAIFGSILISRLEHHIVAALSHFTALPGATHAIVSSGVSSIAKLPPEAQHAVLGAYVQSFHDMFLIGIPFALAAFVVGIFLREAPLRDHHLPKEEVDDVQSHSPVEL